MNKKLFIKNRPFDVNDANDMQNWTEDALKKTMAAIYSSGVVEGLNVVAKTNLQLTLNIGKALNSNYDFINVISAQTITLGIANATNPRYDKIVISYVQSTVNNIDTTNIYGMGTSYTYSTNKLDSYSIQVVAGTPSASPVVPATPVGSIVLAQVYVAANATSISAANITDLRPYIVLSSNINKPIVVFSTTAPLDVTALWIDTNTKESKIYVGSAWIALNANNADTVDGKHASDFALTTHTHTDMYKKIETYSNTELDTNFLKKSDNLNSLTDKAVSRTNLGLGTMAIQSTSAFAASNHNHDGIYTKGDYVLAISTTAPTATTNTMWWDTTNNLIKRYNGTAWLALNAADAATLGGLSGGTGANNLLKLDSAGKVPVNNIPLSSQTVAGAMSAGDKAKLDGIASGAANQNTFSTIRVGATDVVAETVADILEFIAGTNVVLTPDAATDKITIALSASVETTTGAQTKADNVRKDATKMFTVEVKTADPATPVVGQMWFRSDL